MNDMRAVIVPKSDRLAFAAKSRVISGMLKVACLPPKKPATRAPLSLVTPRGNNISGRHRSSKAAMI